MSMGVARTILVRASSALDWVAGGVGVALMVMTFVDVIGRYFFRAPLGGAYELTQYGLAFLVFAALPRVTETGEHVRVDLFDSVLPARLRRVLDFIWRIVVAVALVYLAWRLYFLADRFARYGEGTSTLKVPLAPLVWFMAGASVLSAILAVASPFLRTRDQ